MKALRLTGLTLLLAASLLTGQAHALSLEPVGTFAKPIYVASPPADAARLFVVERAGKIQEVTEAGVEEYADISGRVDAGSGERGLASMAFDPEYATTGKVYVAYTTNADTAELDPGDIVVEELTEPEQPEDPFASRVVLVVPHAGDDIHNGGQLQFGPDGMLYLSTGDGGLFDPREYPQDVESGLGKILRFDPDAAVGYDVPAGNPFSGPDFAPIVWALGLRNPFRFSFDRLSGDLVIGDVGEGAREEIDLAPSPGAGAVGGTGANYGWPCREGLLPGLDAAKPSCVGLGPFDPPAFEYDHFVPEPAKGVVCSGSVIGGYVVRDPALGDLAGRYVYADYCSGEIRAVQLPAGPDAAASGDCSLGLPRDRWNSFGEDAAGRLYVASSKGGVYRFAGPLETCVADAEQPAGGTEATTAPPQVLRERRPVRLLISAQPRAHLGRAAWISVRAAPCEGQSKRTVELLRGGEPDGARKLGSDCRARFGRRIEWPSAFRANLAATVEEPAVSSRRLVVRLAAARG